VPSLIHLNGPPGIGKSSLARRYLQDHLFAFCLDIDEIRCQIGNWDHHEQESGYLARKMALAMVDVHLACGHDVIVPQMALRAEFVDQLASAAMHSEATFHEVVLWADLGTAESRFDQRASDNCLSAHHRDAARMIERVGGYATVYHDLKSAISELSNVITLEIGFGDLEESYRAFVLAMSSASTEDAG
jgi:hypothetical protein